MKNRTTARIRTKPSPRQIFPGEAGSAGPRLLELIRLRVAQIHQCPVSIENHEEKLATLGETRERLRQLKTWVISSLFDGQERAALALCERVSLEPGHPLPDYLIHELRPYFSKAAILNLILAIMAVNDWIFLGGQHHIVCG